MKKTDIDLLANAIATTVARQMRPPTPFFTAEQRAAIHEMASLSPWRLIMTLVITILTMLLMMLLFGLV